MAKEHKKVRPWVPEQFASLVCILVFKVIILLPWPAIRWLGRSLGWLCYHFFPIRRKVVRTNLRLAFPALSAGQREQLVRAHYDSVALGLFETVKAWWSPASRLPAFTLEGMDNLKAALAAGRGALMLTTHMTTLEICGRMLVERHAFGCFYRDPNNPVVAQEMRLSRERNLSIAVHFDDLRGLVRALRAGHAMWYAPDQGKRTKLSEILPFFGEPAITNTATSRIARMSGSPVVPFVGYRLPDGRYHIVILPALADFPSGDDSADALRVNKVMEELILRAPDQYLWLHRRYKGRGPGHPDAYRQ